MELLAGNCAALSAHMTFSKGRWISVNYWLPIVTSNWKSATSDLTLLKSSVVGSSNPWPCQPLVPRAVPFPHLLVLAERTTAFRNKIRTWQVPELQMYSHINRAVVAMDSFFALNWSGSLAKWSQAQVRAWRGRTVVRLPANKLTLTYIFFSALGLSFVIIYTQDQERMSYNVLIPY